MATWEIILLAVFGALVLLFLVGFLAVGRRRRERDGGLAERLREADRALAAARAADRGWDPALLEEAARAALQERRPGARITALELVQVVDRPGTDEDTARMLVTHADGSDEIDLQRTGDRWHAA